MMSGRPVIATASAGTADYVEEGVDGVLVPRVDARAMRSTIERLWNDADARAALGAAARLSATRRFTFSAVAPDLERLVAALARTTR